MKLLVCESKDEVNLARAVLGGLPADVETHNLRGTDRLEGFAPVVVNRPDFPDLDAIGLLLDAEEDPAATHARARAFFAAIGHPDLVAGHVTHARPRVGWFLLPDGSAPGAYETLIRRAADPIRSGCVDGLFTCAGGLPTAATTQAHRDKVWFHAYAATLGPEGRHAELFGPPPRIDPSHAAFEPLRAFLSALVG